MASGQHLARPAHRPHSFVARGHLQMDFVVQIILSPARARCFALKYAGWCSAKLGHAGKLLIYFDILTVIGILAFIVYVRWVTCGHAHGP
jgi:hypothetical protein